MDIMKKVLLAAVTVLLVAPLAVPGTTAQAATWHKGAPKIARGTWTDKRNSPKGGMYDSLHITHKLFVLNDNDPHLTHLKYKKVGRHTSKFRGYEFELGKTITTAGNWHFISRHHVRVTLDGHKMNLYR